MSNSCSGKAPKGSGPGLLPLTSFLHFPLCAGTACQVITSSEGSEWVRHVPNTFPKAPQPMGDKQHLVFLSLLVKQMPLWKSPLWKVRRWTQLLKPALIYETNLVNANANNANLRISISLCCSPFPQPACWQAVENEWSQVVGRDVCRETLTAWKHCCVPPHSQHLNNTELAFRTCSHSSVARLAILPTYWYAWQDHEQEAADWGLWGMAAGMPWHL